MLKNIIRRFIRADEEGLRTHKAMLRLISEARGSANLLDIGCAQGDKTLDYAGLLGISPDKIKGIEPQERYRLLAQEKFETLAIDVEKEGLPFTDEAFDLIVCNQVLEHLKNIFFPLSEMDRTLKTGGYLVIGIPNLAGLYNRLLLLAGAQPLCCQIGGPHVRAFTHRAFTGFLKANPNFELIKTDSATLYPLPYPLSDWLGRRWHDLAAYTFYLLKKKRHAPGACSWRQQSIGDTCFE